MFLIAFAGCAPTPATPDPAPTPTPRVSLDPAPEWFTDLPAPAPEPPPADTTPGAFVVDGAGDLFAAYTDAGLIAVHPANGATPRVIVRARALPRREEIFDLALDTADVWFTSLVRTSDGSRAAYALRRVAKAGGPATVVTRGSLGDGGLVGEVFVGASDVWFLRSAANDPYAYDLVKIPKTGGAESTVVEHVGGFSPVVRDGTSFYVAAAGGVARVPEDGGPVTAIAPAEDEVRSIVTSATDVYFTVREGARLHLYRAPKAGGKRVSLATFSAVQPALFYEGGTLYWNEATEEIPSPHRIVARSGTKPRTVAEGLPSGEYWRVQDGVAYWQEGARFVRVPVR